MMKLKERRCIFCDRMVCKTGGETHAVEGGCPRCGAIVLQNISSAGEVEKQVILRLPKESFRSQPSIAKKIKELQESRNVQFVGSARNY